MNYIDYYNKYKYNNNETKGILNQYKFICRYYIATLKFLNIDIKFADITKIPNDKHEWIKIIDDRLTQIYEDEYNKFIKSNGSLIFKLFKYNKDYVLNSKNQYKGLIKYIQILAG